MRSIYLLLFLCTLNSPSWGQRFIPLTAQSANSSAVQHTPLTPATPSNHPLKQNSVSPPTVSSAPEPKRKQTHKLFELQADKNRPGQALPVLGATANRSWQRYLDSFTHPIPEQFEERVSSKNE